MTNQAKYRTRTASLETIGLEIGNTPLLRIDALSTRDVVIYAKAEWKQLSRSVKARAAYRIIRNAIRNGDLTSEKRLLDASSGNTAIAYATILKRLGLGCTICLPTNASKERISTLQDLGAEIVFTSPLEGTEGSQQVAREMASERPEDYYYADQYNNPANLEAHYEGTSREILTQTNGNLTHFVAGLGTTGTFTGTVQRLKEVQSVVAIGLQPNSAMHIMEGWKHLETATVPGIYIPSLANEIREIDSDDVYGMMRFINRKEGLRLSPSSAANLVGAKTVASTLEKGVVVTVLPDSIERYQDLNREIYGR